MKYSTTRASAASTFRDRAADGPLLERTSIGHATAKRCGMPPRSPAFEKGRAVARGYEVALPHELNRGQRVELVRAFAGELANRYGVAVDFFDSSAAPDPAMSGTTTPTS